MRLSRLISRTRRVDSLRAHLRREEGATLIEFAFSLGVFLAATIGIMVLCMALFTYEYVDFASREAVRWAAVRGSQCINMPQCDASATDVQTYVKGLNYPIVNPNNLTVTTTWLQATYTTNPVTSSGTTTWTACASSCNSPGNVVQVKISYPFGFYIPFIGNFAPNVSSTSQMVISQ